MSFFHRLPVIVTLVALLLGATLPAGGAAVVCFAGDHVAVEVAGGAHCREDRPARETPTGLVKTQERCVDVAAAAVTLDRPAATELFWAERAGVPAGGVATRSVPADRPEEDAASRGRPPPHLGPLSVCVLRI